MPKKTKIGKRLVEVNSSILAFTPRQVLLSSKPPRPQSTMKVEQTNNDDSNINKKTLVLNPEQKTLLLHSIARYLERSGFSKTLKKFRSEADIKKDDLIDSSFDLEEIFCKFLGICSNHVTKTSKNHKVQAGELQTDDISKVDKEGNFVSNVDDGKRKRKTDKSANDKSTHSKNAEENHTPNTNSMDVKSKEKKKSQKNQSNLDSEAIINNDGGTEEKSKSKKKNKKNKLASDPIVDEEKPGNGESGKRDFKTLKEDGTENQDKKSKKRKRLASEEDSLQPAGEKFVEVSEHLKTEESKRRKIEGSEEPKAREKFTDKNSSSRIEEKEKSQIGSVDSQKASTKEIDAQLNGSLENGGMSPMKKTKKQQNGSAEPKSVKHFQRIKVDEVVISDERLKDNSYWAKAGSDTGYGAKAQEVLGQVRGRGFRHEKTKKKRGSYRGGQIDLQSYSVKFNYSDDD